MELTELIEEMQFLDGLSDKRHKETISTLGKIISELNKPAVEVKQVDMQKLETIISNINSNAPKVPDMSIISNTLEQIGKVITEKIQSLKTDTREIDTLKVIRNSNGVIDLVKVNYKQ